MTTRVRNSGRREFTLSSYRMGQVVDPPTKREIVRLHNVVESEEHPFRHELNRVNRDKYTAKRNFIDTGGNFSSAKIAVDSSTDLKVRTVSDEIYQPSGELWFETSSIFVPSNQVKLILELQKSYRTPAQYADEILASVPTPLSNIMLDAAGTTAISRCIPTNPVVDLATSIAETVGAKGLFSIPGKALKKGDVSGEYLNTMLGVLPVVSDAKGIYEAATTSEKVLKQLERDSGSLIRRRYEFPETLDTTTTVEENVFPAALGDATFNSYQIKHGTRTTVTTTRTKLWFSGAFTYYLPKSGWRKTLAQYQRLLGIVPGSETAWNVVPFSFVADYFFNTGDMLHNLDAFARDGLIMPYGYLMSHQEIEEKTVWRGGFCTLGIPHDTVLTSTIKYSMKQRRRANPFGFGLTVGDLQPRQLSILAALGMSRK